MLRSPCDPVIWPRVPPVKTVGAFSILVFVRLRNSDRNSSFRDSPRENSFLMPMSKSLRPGPRTVPLPQLPKPGVLPVGFTFVKVLGSNHWIPPPLGCETTVLGYLTDPVQFGRLTQPPVFEGSPQLLTVMANPVCRVRIPSSSQPPTTSLATLFMPLPY